MYLKGKSRYCKTAGEAGKKLFMKKGALIIAMAVLLVCLGGCGGEKAEPVEPPEAKPVFYNPVTNLEVEEEQIRTRPIAVMLNNVKQAMPQMGVSRADLYFELPAEGDTNRIMALFYDYEDIPVIGTVRSARDYFVDYARSFDALFLHYGGSPQFYSLRSEIGYDDLDGINAQVESLLYWRDDERRKTKGREHSVMTSGEKIMQTIDALEVRSVLSQDYSPYFQFAPAGQKAPAGHISAEKVSVPFSGYITPVFTYDAESGLYVRSQYGQTHIDGIDQTPLTVTNLVVLQTDISPIAADADLRINFRSTGEGRGYYITEGYAREIRWKKDSARSRLELLDEKGDPVVVNSGKMWICILGKEPVIEPGTVAEASSGAGINAPEEAAL